MLYRLRQLHNQYIFFCTFLESSPPHIILNGTGKRANENYVGVHQEVGCVPHPRVVGLRLGR